MAVRSCITWAGFGTCIMSACHVACSRAIIRLAAGPLADRGPLPKEPVVGHERPLRLDTILELRTAVLGGCVKCVACSLVLHNGSEQSDRTVELGTAASGVGVVPPQAVAAVEFNRPTWPHWPDKIWG
jgi:ferredoxin